MAKTMCAVDIRNGKGPASSLFINPEIPKPQPKPDECLIRVKAFGLNRGDTLQREGLYPMPPGTPKTMGLEFSGIVSAVGEGRESEEDRHWKIGDEVFGLVYGGAYAEFVAVNKKMLLAKPKEWSWEKCGGLVESWFTAFQALHFIGEYNPRTTRSILWHAGTSTISIAGIQLSHLANIMFESSTNGASQPLPKPKIFATTRRDDKCEMCVKELHCDGAVNTTSYSPQGWVDEIKRLNGGAGIDLILDFVGGPYFQQNLDLLALDGKVVNLGLLGGPMVPGNVNMSPFVMKRLRYEGSTLRSRDTDYQIRVRNLFEQKCMPAFINGRLSHPIEKVFKWEDITKAHELMESNETKGKLVCVIED